MSRRKDNIRPQLFYSDDIEEITEDDMFEDNQLFHLFQEFIKTYPALKYPEFFREYSKWCMRNGPLPPVCTHDLSCECSLCYFIAKLANIRKLRIVVREGRKVYLPMIMPTQLLHGTQKVRIEEIGPDRDLLFPTILGKIYLICGTEEDEIIAAYQMSVICYDDKPPTLKIPDRVSWIIFLYEEMLMCLKSDVIDIWYVLNGELVWGVTKSYEQQRIVEGFSLNVTIHGSIMHLPKVVSHSYEVFVGFILMDSKPVYNDPWIKESLIDLLPSGLYGCPTIIVGALRTYMPFHPIYRGKGYFRHSFINNLKGIIFRNSWIEESIVGNRCPSRSSEPILSSYDVDLIPILEYAALKRYNVNVKFESSVGVHMDVEELMSFDLSSWYSHRDVKIDVIEKFDGNLLFNIYDINLIILPDTVFMNYQVQGKWKRETKVHHINIENLPPINFENIHIPQNCEFYHVLCPPRDVSFKAGEFSIEALNLLHDWKFGPFLRKPLAVDALHIKTLDKVEGTFIISYSN